MYMNVAVVHQKSLNPEKEIVPAAILYYHVEDPMIDAKKEMIADDINKEIIGKLKMTGLVNDDQAIIRMLDKGLTSRSDVIPVALKKDGGFMRESAVASMQEYSAISHYVNRKVKEFGKRILEGDIQVNPYEDGQRLSCTYCAYRSICGFDEKIQGYSRRKLTMSSDEALAEIMREDSEN